MTLPLYARQTFRTRRATSLDGVLAQGGMISHEDTCIAFLSDGNPPTQPTARRLWGNARYHNGLIVSGFPSAYDDPTVESPVAFPIVADIE